MEPAHQPSAASVSAGLASVGGGSVPSTAPLAPQALRHPAEDGGRSLAGMAEHDLDAALQLLAERAQYITNASGAAIALRRSGHNDMLCRASAGSNAPQMGALLSAESGLSGESVRTRQPLRCDDAETDPRVNRQSCRELGIASVVVMPVVSEEHVLGVFELFAGSPNAFDERDISALQRLGEMVGTAVTHALAAAAPVGQKMRSNTAMSSDSQQVELRGEMPVARLEPRLEPRSELSTDLNAVGVEFTHTSASESAAKPPTDQRIPVNSAPAPAAPDASDSVAASATKDSPPKRIVMWSAPTVTGVAVQPPSQTPDPIPVPQALRGVHRCQACGFPVSEGRVLCVECEEKQWRGVPIAKPTPAHQSGSSAVKFSEMSSSGAAPTQRATNQRAVETSKVDLRAGSINLPATTPPAATKPVAAGTGSTAFVFSAGAEPSQSWLAANKYVIAAVSIVALVIAVIAWMR